MLSIHWFGNDLITFVNASERVCLCVCMCEESWDEDLNEEEEKHILWPMRNAVRSFRL